MRTYVYIDGFNLFYGILKGIPHKWLDLMGLCEDLLPDECNIQCINYYTAMVKGDPNAVIRQRVYLDALHHHTPKLKYFLGRHQIKAKRFPTAVHDGFDKRGEPKYIAGEKVLVLKAEEKKTDVNIATAILDQAWRNKYDCAVLISNDSDMAPALLAAKHKGKIIGLATTAAKPTGNLQKLCDFHRHITRHLVKTNQLPERIELKGSSPVKHIVKPNDW